MNNYDPYLIGGVVAILGTTVAALIWVIKFMFSKILPLLEHANSNIQTNNRLTKSMEKTTKAADEYLRARNGRDADVAKVLLDTTKKSHDALIKAINAIPTQIVKSANITAKVLSQTPIDQHIEHQEVKQQVVKEIK